VLAEAAELLGLVAGQDVEAGENGIFRIARKVARDRLISIVDVEARHGHNVRWLQDQLGVDPDDELITNVAVTAANTADREVIDELLDQPATGAPAADTARTAVAIQRAARVRKVLRCTGIRPSGRGHPG
jgi:hypothetical protein